MFEKEPARSIVSWEVLGNDDLAEQLVTALREGEVITVEVQDGDPSTISTFTLRPLAVVHDQEWVLAVECTVYGTEDFDATVFVPQPSGLGQRPIIALSAPRVSD